MHGMVEWTGGTSIVGTSADGKNLNFDWSSGPSPMQVMLQMIGACSLVDVVTGLKERPFQRVWIDLSTERSETHPRIFTSIHMAYHVEGDVPLPLVERIVSKSHELYCSVSNMLRDDVIITTEVQIHAPV